MRKNRECQAKKAQKNEKTGALKEVENQGEDTRAGGIAAGVDSNGLFGALFRVRRGHGGDELAGLFQVLLLDQDLEFGQPIDREGIDEGRRPAADDGGDAVTFEETLDQVRFERAVDARGFDEVGAVIAWLVLFIGFGHGSRPFFASR